MPDGRHQGLLSGGKLVEQLVSLSRCLVAKHPRQNGRTVQDETHARPSSRSSRMLIPFRLYFFLSARISATTVLRRAFLSSR